MTLSPAVEANLLHTTLFQQYNLTHCHFINWNDSIYKKKVDTEVTEVYPG